MALECPRGSTSSERQGRQIPGDIMRATLEGNERRKCTYLWGEKQIEADNHHPYTQSIDYPQGEGNQG